MLHPVEPEYVGGDERTYRPAPARGGECPPHLAGLRYRATETMWPYSDDESSSRPVGMASVSERAAPSRKYSGKRLKTQTRAANGMNRV